MPPSLRKLNRDRQCDSRDGVGRLVAAENWNALRAVGENANRQLCDDQAARAMPAPDVETFTQKVTRPSTTEDGLRATGIRFGDRSGMAVLEPILKFGQVIDGFTNRQWSSSLRDYSMKTTPPDRQHMIRGGRDGKD